MAAHVYHWRHGWVPLDHTAALSKAKGNHERAAAMLSDAHSPGAGIHSRQDVAKATLALKDLPNPDDRHAALNHITTAAQAHGATDLLPARENRTRSEVERDLRNTMPPGYDVSYYVPRRGEHFSGRKEGWRVEAPGSPAVTFATANEVHAYVAVRKAAPPKPPVVVESVKAPAVKHVEPAQPKAHLIPGERAVSQRQVDYIMTLLARRRRSGEGGGFMTGPTHRAGVAGMSSTTASAYIRSLTSDY